MTEQEFYQMMILKQQYENMSNPAQQAQDTFDQQMKEKKIADQAAALNIRPDRGTNGGGGSNRTSDVALMEAKLSPEDAKAQLGGLYAAQANPINGPGDQLARSMQQSRQGSPLQQALQGLSSGQAPASKSASGGFSDMNQTGHEKQREYEQQQLQDMMQRLGLDQAKQSMNLSERSQKLQEKQQQDQFGLDSQAEQRRRGIIEGIFPYIGLLMQRLK